MDQKAKEEARKAANKRFREKQKTQTTFCPDCNKSVKNLTWTTHITSKKHLENTFKERKDFFEEFQDLYNLLAIEGSDVRKIFCSMKDLIEGEYYDDNGHEIIPEDEIYTDPTPFARNDVEIDFCGTIFYMEQKIEEQLQKLYNTRPYHVDINYLEKKETSFNCLKKNIDDKDLKKKLLWCFQDLFVPWPKDKTAEEEQKKLEKWDNDRRAQEEALKKKDEMMRPTVVSQAPKVVKIVAMEKKDDDEDDYDDSDPFPAYGTFLRLKNKTKNKILAFIADNFMHIFDRSMMDLFDIIEFKKTQDYDESYRFALQCKNDYDDRHNDENNSMDCSDVEEDEEEAEED